MTSPALEELDRALVRLGLRARRERAEVVLLAGLRLEHSDIDDVMLATSLMPNGLIELPRAS